jgi:electron transfer flavoprotein beta subunit
VLTPADLGVTPRLRAAMKSVAAPPKRQAGKLVGSVEELVEKLATEAKVL